MFLSKLMTTVYKSTDFLDTIKNGQAMVFSTLINKETGADFHYTFTGKVIMSPRKSDFGPISFGIAVNTDQVKFLKEVSHLLNFPITDGWTKTIGLTKDENSMFFKLRVDTNKFRSILFESDFEKWYGVEVDVHTKLNTYFNSEKKICGLYFTVKEVQASVKDSTVGTTL